MKFGSCCFIFSENLVKYKLPKPAARQWAFLYFCLVVVCDEPATQVLCPVLRSYFADLNSDKIL